MSDAYSSVGENLILDFGCTFHMTPNWDYLAAYKPTHKGAVLMGNNAYCKVAGIGTILIKKFNGVVRTLGDLKHVPDLKRNLISDRSKSCMHFSTISMCFSSSIA